MAKEAPPNDTWRIRTTLADMVCDTCSGTIVPGARDRVDVLVPGQTAVITQGTSPKNRGPRITISFAGTKQHTTSLSGRGGTYETGLCVANIVTPCSNDSAADRADAYYVLGSLTQALPRPGRVFPVIRTSATDVTAYNLPTGVTSVVQITKQPDVQPMYVHEGELYIPVMIEYRATTDRT